jgi:MFS transporter, FSR family, fosmidomycin resistance protein
MQLARPRSTLIACCGAHLTQDGLVALQYVLLPILAQTFSLSYAQVGLLRSVSHLAMSLLELPAGVLAERVGERKLLVVGLIGAAVGYLCVAHAWTFTFIAVGFFVAGAGAALQHSLSSSVLVRRFDGGARRKALGTYNSAGDAGKLTFTAAFSAVVGAGVGWNWVVSGLALITLTFAGLLYWLLRPQASELEPELADADAAPGRVQGWGIADLPRFTALGLMVFLDSLVQAVFLTFLAFIMHAKGAGAGIAGAAVVLALSGGMVGKFCCGFVAARLGDRTTFIMVQLLTMVGLASLTVLSADQCLLLLPLVGLVVQGSTTVSYGSVADFVRPGHQARGYALIYTLSSASSVVGPTVLGWVADASDLDVVLWVLVGVTMLTLSVAGILPGRDQSQSPSL